MSAADVPARAPSRRRHSDGSLIRVLALSGALAVHCGLILALSLDHTKPMLDVEAPDAGGGMVVDLVSAPPSQTASTLQPALAAMDASLKSGIGAPLPAGEPAAPSLLAQMDAPQDPIASAKPLTTAPQAALSSDVGLVEDNPWSHAGSPSADASKAHSLWLAAKRCWKGDFGGAPSEIRIIFNAKGMVQKMTWSGADNPDAKARAQKLASALAACAPYPQLVARAGPYLVVGPSA